MSLMNAARNAANLDASASSGQAADPNQKWTDRLVSLLPSEAVGAFLGAIGLCIGYKWSNSPRWIVFAVVAAMTLVWTYGNYFQTLTPEQQKAGRLPMPYWLLSTSLAAYFAWAGTVPGTPYLQWHSWDLKFAPFVTLGAVVVLTGLDKVHAIWKIRHQPDSPPPPAS